MSYSPASLSGNPAALNLSNSVAMSSHLSVFLFRYQIPSALQGEAVLTLPPLELIQLLPISLLPEQEVVPPLYQSALLHNCWSVK